LISTTYLGGERRGALQEEGGVGHHHRRMSNIPIGDFELPIGALMLLIRPTIMLVLTTCADNLPVLSWQEISTSGEICTNKRRYVRQRTDQTGTIVDSALPRTAFLSLCSPLWVYADAARALLKRGDHGQVNFALCLLLIHEAPWVSQWPMVTPGVEN
jgi:hypothetical protein